MKALLRSHTATAASSSASTAAEASSSTISSSPPVSSWIPLRYLLIIASSTHDSDRGSLKSPWSRRKRKHALSQHQWKNLFTPDGKFQDGGVKFLKKVRSGGVDPRIRAEVWPFLLAVYDLSTSEADRNAVKSKRRKEYKKLRKQCHQLLKPADDSCMELKEVSGHSSNERLHSINGFDSFCSEDILLSSRHSFDEESDYDVSQPLLCNLYDEATEEEEESDTTCVNVSSDSDCSFEELESDKLPSVMEMRDEIDMQYDSVVSLEMNSSHVHQTPEDFGTWQRIIRLDALRASSEWVVYSPKQAAVSEDCARKHADDVGLKDYENLEPYRLYHAARLVAILESYALYDQETGYCQGMSDLLSPILAVMEKDHEAFWCFVGFMRKARHNFRRDEVGIQRQLKIVSKIIKMKDAHLYRHLENLQAEDCFFVYRMVLVLFRRELTFEQTVCLWEVMWADQSAIRARIGKSAWRKSRMKAPPTDDLLLFAIAACVLKRRKLIIEKYISMDEIVKEFNNMAGHLDVWKLLNDAHDLVVGFHDKVS